jgi:hypothetical protein
MYIPIVTISSGACYMLHAGLWGMETSFLDMLFDFMRGHNTIGEIVPETSAVLKKLSWLRWKLLNSVMPCGVFHAVLGYWIVNIFKLNVSVMSDQNPCGGGVEYLHREPASRKR